MKLRELNTQILTLVLLDVLCTTLFPSFNQIHLNIPIISIYLQTELKTRIFRSPGSSEAS